MNHIKSDLENFQHTNVENDREPILDQTSLLRQWRQPKVLEAGSGFERPG